VLDDRCCGGITDRLEQTADRGAAQAQPGHSQAGSTEGHLFEGFVRHPDLSSVATSSG
jgi:hypothetical protein